MKQIAIALLGICAFFSAAGKVQGGQAAAATPPVAKAAAPIDLTGTWVSVVSKDWRWRMITPPKGDYASIPLNPKARKVADTWDPAKDKAAGEQCKAYGPPGVMRLPGRLRISWQDDNTLKVETDAGTQTRLLHFGTWKPPAAPATLQGNSVARWEFPPTRDPKVQAGDLSVVTTQMRPGYLRKNGVPYSADAVLTEYWDLFERPGNERWIVITTLVIDPTYLDQDWITSLSFKKESNDFKWDPSPCSGE